MNVCVALMVPEHLAAQFPELRHTDGSVAEPHVTVVYLPDADWQVVAAAVESLVTELQPFGVHLTGGTHTLAPSAGSNGRTVVCATVQSEGLLAFRAALLAKLGPDAAAKADAQHGGYTPHATLAYLGAGEAYAGPQPKGTFLSSSIAIWCDEPTSLALTRRYGRKAQAWRAQGQTWSEATAPPPPGTRIHNPKGLHLGTPFRVMTADAPVRDATTGELLGCFSEAVLHEFVQVFYARVARGDGQPGIDNNHGPTLGGDQTVLGEVLGAYVAADARGPGLYVIPGYTDHGRAWLAKHKAPGKGSVLTNSPEFYVGAVYARGDGDPNEQGAHLGGAELLGVGLTSRPQQPAKDIDPVVFSNRGQTAGAAGKEVPAMPDQTQQAPAAPAAGAPPVAPEAAAAPPIGDLEPRVSGLEASVAKILGLLESMQADRASMAADVAAEAKGQLEEFTAEKMGEVEATAEEAVQQLTADEVKLLEEETPVAERMALTRGTGGSKARFHAFTRRTDRAKAILSGRQMRALTARLEQSDKNALAAQCDAAMVALRAQGMSRAEEGQARYLWTLKHDPKVVAALSSVGMAKEEKDHPYFAFTQRIATNPTVPLGVNGVRTELGTRPEPAHTVAKVKAWAESRGFKGLLSNLSAQYCREHNISEREITQ